MKVLFLSTRNPFGAGPLGGAEVSIGNMARVLTERGHSISILSACQKQSSPDATPNAITKYKFLKVGGGISERTRVINSIFAAIALRSALKKNMPEIIYCSYDPILLSSIFDYSCLPRSHRYNKPKVVVRMAGEYWYHLIQKRPAYKKRYSQWFGMSDAIHFLSESSRLDTMALFEKSGMGKKEVTGFVMDPGISLPKHNGLMSKAKSKKDFRCLMAARFAGPKRQDLLIRAFSFLRDINVNLTLIGEGANLDRCIKLCEAHGLSDRVNFMPFVSNSELTNMIPNYDLACLISDHEGLSKFTLEAMSCGVPVIASDISSMKSIFANCNCGLLVKNEPEEIAQKIRYLYTNQNEADNIGVLGLERVKEFDLAEKIPLLEEKLYGIIDAK